MIPAEKLVRVVDRSKQEPEGVVFNVQVGVEDFKFLADIIVMDKTDCPVILGKTLPTKCNIDKREQKIRRRLDQNLPKLDKIHN